MFNKVSSIIFIFLQILKFIIMINKVVLVGNVGKDPEVKYFDNDSVVANFSLATSESYTNKNGEKVTNTEWHNIQVWRGLAKVVEKYVKKGDLLYVEGKIKTRSYDDKDGNKKYTTEIQVDELKMLGGRSNKDSSDYSTTNAATSQVRESASVTNDSDIDDLPF